MWERLTKELAEKKVFTGGCYEAGLAACGPSNGAKAFDRSSDQWMERYSRMMREESLLSPI
jgi:hypothetical protein